ncbi:hypothetical protein EJ07DRAFT_148244, partial [Lizonia empirigonia]
CRRKSPRSGMDSDLEAFSHNPADGSFAAMPGQTAAKTNYLKRGSSRTKRYYHWGKVISRVKLTCLTTV